MIVIGENSVGDARDVEAIIETLRDAGRAVERGDPDGVAAMFGPGDEATIFDFLAPGICGVEDIRRNEDGLEKEKTRYDCCDTWIDQLHASVPIPPEWDKRGNK